MKNTDTPETDASTYSSETFAVAGYTVLCVHQDLSRKIERERDQARAIADGLAARINDAAKHLTQSPTKVITPWMY